MLSARDRPGREARTVRPAPATELRTVGCAERRRCERTAAVTRRVYRAVGIDANGSIGSGKVGAAVTNGV